MVSILWTTQCLHACQLQKREALRPSLLGQCLCRQLLVSYCHTVDTPVVLHCMSRGAASAAAQHNKRSKACQQPSSGHTQCELLGELEGERMRERSFELHGVHPRRFFWCTHTLSTAPTPPLLHHHSLCHTEYNLPDKEDVQGCGYVQARGGPAV